MPRTRSIFSAIVAFFALLTAALLTAYEYQPTLTIEHDGWQADQPSLRDFIHSAQLEARHNIFTTHNAHKQHHIDQQRGKKRKEQADQQIRKKEQVQKKIRSLLTPVLKKQLQKADQLIESTRHAQSTFAIDSWQYKLLENRKNQLNQNKNNSNLWYEHYYALTRAICFQSSIRLREY